MSFEASGLEKGKISFRRAQFGEGIIDFELAEFDQVDANFDRAVFGEGSVSFRNARFGSLSLASCHLDYYLDLRLAHGGHINLSDTVARDIIDLKPYDSDLDIPTINFSGMRLIGRIFIDWKQNKVKSLIYSQTDTGNRQKAEQFRILKENFRVTGQYSDEDKAYVEFKRLESKSQLEISVSRKRLSLVTKSFYHSAITFLTIGYGDYYPSGVIRWVSSAVGFTGLFLMS